MKISSIIFFTLIFSVFSHLADNSNRFLMLEPLGYANKPQEWAGFFACFSCVLGGLDYYEKNNFQGCTVCFNWGLYLDQKRGNNWWEYYFEPIDIGSQKNADLVRLDNAQKHENAFSAISSISRERAFNLIQKYIKLKKDVQKKIDDFVAQNFGDSFVIGIHYRGTDKTSEAPRVAYEEYVNRVSQVILTLQLNDAKKNYKIFIATDEANFINYMKNVFGSKICALDAVRSHNNEPIHLQPIDPYRLGLEAVMDCVLLSKTDILIRAHSNLSSNAANFNPHLLMITVNTHNNSNIYPMLR